MQQYGVKEWLEFVLLRIVRGLTMFSDVYFMREKLCTVTTASISSRGLFTPARSARLRLR